MRDDIAPAILKGLRQIFSYGSLILVCFVIAERASAQKNAPASAAAARDLIGTVVDPSGKPVGGVTVIRVTPGRTFMIVEGKPDVEPDAIACAMTDVQGRFDFPPRAEVFMLVALSDRGQCVVNPSEITPQSRLVLKPWGRAKGRVFIGTKPAVGVTVDAQSANEVEDMEKEPCVHFQVTTRTDAQGGFTLEHLPDLDTRFNRRMDSGGKNYIHASSSVKTIKPGTTLTLQLGGTGRPVIGKIVLPPELQGQSWGNVNASLSTKTEDIEPTFPADYASMSVEQRKQWYATWENSDAGKAYAAACKAETDRTEYYDFNLSADGSFRVDDVDPGTYAVVIKLLKPLSGEELGHGEDMAQATAEVTVPPIRNGAQGDAPVLIPDMVATALTSVGVGEIAPDFTVPTIDGRQIGLKDFRGKYLLLDFWATWCGPCCEEMQTLKKLHDKYRDNDKFAMLSLSLDETLSDARDFIKQQSLAWPQGFLGNWDQAKLPNVYGVRDIPSIWLIGPDGKVVAKNLYGDGIEAAVARAMAK